MKIKTVLFARVSTREQADEGYSLPAQEKLLKEYADKKDLFLVKRFSVPESASGKQERKLFNELVDYIYNSKDIKVVICEKVDRITRNFKDAVKLQDWLEEDEERQIHFVKQNLIIHKNSKSTDQLMWDIFLSLARNYSNNLSEETKKGMNEKAEQGHYPGNHKRGYKTFGDIGHKVWFKDNDTQDLKYIERAFVLYNTGSYTLRTLAKELFTQGWIIRGKAISTSELHYLLTDPFYCGEFEWKGRLYKNAKHEPLISKELYYSVQERLQRKITGGKYRKHTFLFGGGIFVCGECGRAITAETQKGHNYYHCTKYKTNCSQKQYVKEEELESQVLDILGEFKIEDTRLLEWVRKALKEVHKGEDEYYSETIKELEIHKQQIERRLSILYDDRLDERITKDFYESKSKQYEDELNVVLEAINKHTKANVNYMQLGINIFELTQKGRDLYANMKSQEDKTALLNFVFLNLKLKDKKLVPTLQNGFDVVSARAKDGNWLKVIDDVRTFYAQSQQDYYIPQFV